MAVFSVAKPFRLSVAESTYLPSGEAQLHLTTSLSLDSLVFLEASADGARRDGQVAVVAVP
jgi:hypothetical protein